MPTRKTQGQSGDATEQKQRGLSFAFRVGLSVIAKPKFRPFRYFRCDLHAGGGYNDDAGCIGSPLTFKAETDVVGCENYFAAFCDKDADAVRRLLAQPGLDDERCAVFHGDNRELLSVVPDIVRHFGENPNFAIGSVLSDPNGADVPLDAMIALSRICPRIDLIFHWNSTITKRGLNREQVRLSDVPRLMGKSHWLIRRPVGIHQFAMLVGRNWPFGDYQKIGFYHLNSLIGQSIMETCSLSKREIMQRDQSDFFDAPVSNL